VEQIDKAHEKSRCVAAEVAQKMLDFRFTLKYDEADFVNMLVFFN